MTLRNGTPYSLTTTVAGAGANAAQVIAEVQVNAQAALLPGNPALHQEIMAELDTISSHLFLPRVAFSKVKGNKSVSPSATAMKQNAVTVSDAVSSAVNEKARKTIEMEARQVPGGLKKTIKNLTRLEDGPITPHYPKWLEAMMRIAEFYPTLAMETIVHPVGKHLANNPSAVNVLKQEYDLNDIQVCSTAGAYDVSWEKQYKLFEIMRHCWDETACRTRG